MLWSPLFDWSFEPVPIVGTAAAAYLYWRARRTTATALGRSAGWDNGDLAFTLGLGTLLLALVSPIAYFDVTLQWDHMLQHVLLLVVAPPLILLGDPFRTVWAGYLTTQRRQVAIAETWPARAMRALHTGPGAAAVTLVFSVNLLVWHLPPVYDATLRFASVHEVEHALFLGLGLLFWDQVVGAVGVGERLSPLGRSVVVLSGMFVSWGLAVLLAYTSTPLYAYPLNGGLNLLTDQQIAAGVMWVPGSIPFVIALVWLGARWFDLDGRTAASPAATRR